MSAMVPKHVEAPNSLYLAPQMMKARWNMYEKTQRRIGYRAANVDFPEPSREVKEQEETVHIEMAKKPSERKRA